VHASIWLWGTPILLYRQWKSRKNKNKFVIWIYFILRSMKEVEDRNIFSTAKTTTVWWSQLKEKSVKKISCIENRHLKISELNQNCTICESKLLEYQLCHLHIYFSVQTSLWLSF
jgi:hypothetical protein